MVISIVFLVLAAGFGGLVLWDGLRKVQAAKGRGRSWLAVEGRVTALSRRGRYCAPVYAYSVEGREYSGVSEVATTGVPYPIGVPVRLLVNPARPAESVVFDSLAGNLPWVQVAIGLAMIVMGLAIVVPMLLGNVR